MNEDKQDNGYVPPWVGLCGYCEKRIGAEDDHVHIWLEERLPERKRRVLLYSFLCSEKCLQTVLSFGSRFGRRLKNYHYDKEPLPRKLLSEDSRVATVIGHCYPVCSYCGEWADETKYHIELLAGGTIDGKKIGFINTFCSENCFQKALDLGPRYFSFAVDAYDKERCIKNKLIRG